MLKHVAKAYDSVIVDVVFWDQATWPSGYAQVGSESKARWELDY
jgi:hypothetical protein